MRDRGQYALARSQLGGVAGHSGSEIEISASSSWREFDGGSITQAGIVGGAGHCRAMGGPLGEDVQALSATVHSITQPISIGLSIVQFLCVMGIDVGYLLLQALSLAGSLFQLGGIASSNHEQLLGMVTAHISQLGTQSVMFYRPSQQCACCRSTYISQRLHLT